MTTLSARPATVGVDRSRILRAGAIAVLGSVVANVVLLFILRSLLNLSASFMPFSIGAIAGFTALYSVLAVVLFWLLARFTKQPVRNFVILAVVGFVLTALPNFSLAANPAGAPFPGSSADYLTLLLFHLPPFAIILWALVTQTRARS
jgi:hypothetical protein